MRVFWAFILGAVCVLVFFPVKRVYHNVTAVTVGAADHGDYGWVYDLSEENQRFDAKMFIYDNENVPARDSTIYEATYFLACFEFGADPCQSTTVTGSLKVNERTQGAYVCGSGDTGALYASIGSGLPLGPPVLGSFAVIPQQTPQAPMYLDLNRVDRFSGQAGCAPSQLALLSQGGD